MEKKSRANSTHFCYDLHTVRKFTNNSILVVTESTDLQQNEIQICNKMEPYNKIPRMDALSQLILKVTPTNIYTEPV